MPLGGNLLASGETVSDSVSIGVSGFFSVTVSVAHNVSSIVWLMLCQGDERRLPLLIACRRHVLVCADG